MHGSISVSGLGYALPDGTPLFQNLQVTFGRLRTGLVGANGAGKSTLLSILAGRLAPTHGGVERPAAVAWLPQSSPLHEVGSVCDLLGCGETLPRLRRALAGTASVEDLAALDGLWDLEERIQASLERCGVGYLAPEDAVSRLSGGERVRVRFAGLLLADPGFLLLDEPTNHLDTGGRGFVREFVRSWSGGLVLASHDRRLLALVDQIAELSAHGLRLYGGNYAFYREQKSIEAAAAHQAVQAARETLDDAERQARLAAERQQRRTSRGAREFRERGGMPKILAGMRKRNAEKTAGRLRETHDDRVDAARKTLAAARARIDAEREIAVDLGTELRPRRTLLTLDGVNHGFGNGPDLWRAPVNLVVKAGDRIAVTGANGTGKTVLLRLAAGLLKPRSGTVVLNTTRSAWLDQHTEALAPGTILENARRRSQRPEDELRLLLARFGFPNDAVYKDTSVLSGGERVRAALACLLAADQTPDLLLLDEPDNHLDINAMEAVAGALRNYRGALIIVSHDQQFLVDVGIDRELELSTLPKTKKAPVR